METDVHGVERTNSVDRARALKSQRTSETKRSVHLLKLLRTIYFSIISDLCMRDFS